MFTLLMMELEPCHTLNECMWYLATVDVCMHNAIRFEDRFCAKKNGGIGEVGGDTGTW